MGTKATMRTNITFFCKMIYAGLSKELSNLLAPIKAHLVKKHKSVKDYVPNEKYDNDFFIKLKESGCAPELALQLASIKYNIDKDNNQQ